MIRWSLTVALTLLMIGCTSLTPQPDLHAMALWAPWSPPLAGHAARQSTWDTSGGNADSLQIAPGETADLLNVDGSGIVRHIWITTNAFEPGGRTIVLRMFWDGDENPAVEVPLGDFFAVGHGVDAEVIAGGKGRAPSKPREFRNPGATSPSQHPGPVVEYCSNDTGSELPQRRYEMK